MYAREPLADMPNLEETPVIVSSRRYGDLETHLDLDQLSQDTHRDLADGDGRGVRAARDRLHQIRTQSFPNTPEAELDTLSRTPPSTGVGRIKFRVTASLGRGDVCGKRRVTLERRRNRGPLGHLENITIEFREGQFRKVQKLLGHAGNGAFYGTFCKRLIKVFGSDIFPWKVDLPYNKEP